MACTSYDKIIRADLIKREQDEVDDDDRVVPRPWDIHQIPYVVLHVRPEVIIGVTVINKGENKKYKEKKQSKRLISNSEKIKPLKLIKTSRRTYRIDSRLKDKRGLSGCISQCKVVLQRIKLPISESDKTVLIRQTSLKKTRRKSKDVLYDQVRNISLVRNDLVKVNFQQCRVVLERIDMKTFNIDSNGNILYSKNILNSPSKSVRFQQHPSITRIPNRSEIELNLNKWRESDIEQSSYNNLSILESNDRISKSPINKSLITNISNEKKVKAFKYMNSNENTIRSLQQKFVDNALKFRESHNNGISENDANLLNKFQIKECIVRLQRISEDVINATVDIDHDKCNSINLTASIPSSLVPLKSILKSPDRGKENSTTLKCSDPSTPTTSTLPTLPELNLKKSAHTTARYCVSKICTFPSISLKIKKQTLKKSDKNKFRKTLKKLNQINDNKIVQNVKLKECCVVLKRIDVSYFLK